MHRSIILDHEMMVEGKKLRERKEITSSTDEDGNVETLTTHMRSINDLVYTVKETNVDGEIRNEEVETDMNDEELEIFKENWEEMWNPTICQENTGVIAKFFKSL